MSVLSAIAPSLVSHSDIYDGRLPILPLTIQVSMPVDADVVSSSASCSPARSVRCTSVHCASSVLLVGSEPGVMSVFSSDTDPDIADELCHFQPLLASVSPVSPVSAGTSPEVMVSPSNYPARDVPVVRSSVSPGAGVSRPSRAGSFFSDPRRFSGVWDISGYIIQYSGYFAGDTSIPGGLVASLGSGVSSPGGSGVFE